MRISSGSSKAARLDVFFFHRNYSNGTPFFAYNGIFPLVCSSAQTFLQTPEKKEKFWHFMKEQKEQITPKKKKKAEYGNTPSVFCRCYHLSDMQKERQTKNICH